MRNPDVAVKYALEQKRILFTLQQYASASVRILLQRLGPPYGFNTSGPRRCSIFIPYSVDVRILLQRLGLPVVSTQVAQDPTQ